MRTAAEIEAEIAALAPIGRPNIGNREMIGADDFRKTWAAYGITRYWYVMYSYWDGVTLRAYRHGGHECLFRVECGSPL